MTSTKFLKFRSLVFISLFFSLFFFEISIFLSSFFLFFISFFPFGHPTVSPDKRCYGLIAFFWRNLPISFGDARLVGYYFGRKTECGKRKGREKE